MPGRSLAAHPPASTAQARAPPPTALAPHRGGAGVARAACAALISGGGGGGVGSIPPPTGVGRRNTADATAAAITATMRRVREQSEQPHSRRTAHPRPGCANWGEARTEGAQSRFIRRRQRGSTRRPRRCARHPRPMCNMSDAVSITNNARQPADAVLKGLLAMTAAEVRRRIRPSRRTSPVAAMLVPLRHSLSGGASLVPIDKARTETDAVTARHRACAGPYRRKIGLPT